jgi:oxygen-independent coproporphyrinogen-3 oxidase
MSQGANEMKIEPNSLNLNKFNISVPRYTSYPVITDWKGQDEDKWLESLDNAYDLSVDLYIHIPFCKELCYYCGCFRKVTKNTSLADNYIDYLYLEWTLYTNRFPNIKINSMHLGGGTPSFLTSEQLERLLGIFEKHKGLHFDGNIELDPRTVSLEHIKTLRKYGFETASLGIQDFDKDVQAAINRHQDFEMVKQLVAELREQGFKELNFDLIWGLPKQSVDTIAKTLEYVLELKPERISFFSYAHLPEKIKNQRLIKDEDLLQGNEKLDLFFSAQKTLLENDYQIIGMDHYALKGSALDKAVKSKSLHRNFMGYIPHKSDALIGLGVSSISQNSAGFVQNTKDFKEYEEIIDNGELPIVKGHHLTSSEAYRSEIIQKIFCHFEIEKEAMKELSNYSDIINQLAIFVDEGLLNEEDLTYQLTYKGKFLIRVVASVFDQYRDQNGGFSKAI